VSPPAGRPAQAEGPNGRPAPHEGPDYQIGFTKNDLLCALGDSLEARAAEPVDGHRGRFDRRSRSEPDVAGEVNRISGGLEHVTKHHVVHLIGANAASGERSLCRDRTQFGCREILESSPKCPKAGASTGQEDNVGGWCRGAHRGPREGELNRTGMGDEI
jgi:hypothetical protein